MTTVGLFGSARDQEVRALAARLRSRGAEPWIVDFARYPRDLRVTFQDDRVLVDGRDVREMGSAYLRQVGRNLPAHARYAEPTEAKEPRCWSALHRVTVEAFARERRFHALRNAVIQTVARKRPVINPPVPQNLHRQKPLLFTRLVRAGLPVPAFLASSDASQSRRFAEQGCRAWSGVVDKPSAGIYKTVLWQADATQEPSRPKLLQRFIRGDTVRCYVLKHELCAAARIVHAGSVDSSTSQTGIETLKLDARQRAIAEGTSRALGLAFCGMDLMIDDTTGETWVIDCNLSPMFVNFAKLSLVDIPGRLADVLIEAGAEEGKTRRPAVLDLVDDVKSLLADPEIAAGFRGVKRPGGED